VNQGLDLTRVLHALAGGSDVDAGGNPPAAAALTAGRRRGERYLKQKEREGEKCQQLGSKKVPKEKFLSMLLTVRKEGQ
jgi:hypothetical protein